MKAALAVASRQKWLDWERNGANSRRSGAFEGASSCWRARVHPRLASLRYDLAKLRAKGLVAKLPRSRRYQLLPRGYSICLIFLKLFERVYAPLTAGLLSPVRSDPAARLLNLSDLPEAVRTRLCAADRRPA